MVYSYEYQSTQHFAVHVFISLSTHQNTFDDTYLLQVFDQPFNALLENAFLRGLHLWLALGMGKELCESPTSGSTKTGSHDPGRERGEWC